MTGIESADIDRMLNSAGAAAANDPTANEASKQRAPPDSEPAGDSASASDSSSGASDDAAKRKKRRRETSEQRERNRSRRRRSRSRSKDRHRSRRDRDRRDRDRRDRDRDRDRRERDRRDRGDKRSRDRDRDRDRPSRREVGAEPPINQSTQVRGGGGRLRQMESQKLLGPEEIMKREQEQIDRDQRTVFASQIHPKVTLREIFDFFSQVGKVRDVQCIQDQRTRKFKGLSYIEMDKVESVPLALALNGHNLKGYPVSVQLTQAEKNRAAQQAAMATRALNEQPMRVRVESLPLEMTEDDIRSLFVPFGRIDGVELEKNGAGKSLGMAWIGFRRAAEAQIAVNELNSMQLLGKQIAVTLEMPLVMQQLQAVAMQCTTASSTGGFSGQLGELDDDSGGGLHMSAQSRMALMQRLQRTEHAAPPAPASSVPQQRALPDVRRIQETSCVVLKNLFSREEVQNDPDLPIDVKEDVEGEAVKHGELLHIGVDAQSDGHVFLRYASVDAARSAFASFDGRWFASKQISAEYVVEPSYELRFPGSGERSSRQ